MGSIAASGAKTGGPRRLGKSLALLIAFFLLSGSGNAGVVRVGEAAPDFSLRDLSGTAVSLAGKKGNVVLLYFWAECAACQRQLPGLESVYARNRGKGLDLLAVNVGQKRMIVELYARQTALSFPVLVDEKMAVARRYGVNRVPTIYLLDRQGMVREKVLGEIDAETLEKKILAALER